MDVLEVVVLSLAFGVSLWGGRVVSRMFRK